MKSYHIFDLDNEYLILETLEYKERVFSKEIQRFKSLDKAEEYVRIIQEDGISTMNSGPSLSGAIPKSPPDGAGVAGIQTLLNLKGKAPDILRRKKPITSKKPKR